MSEAALHILLVEDNPDDADLLQETLAAALTSHWRSRTSNVCRKLLEYLKQGDQVDAVLLDLGLPDSMGIATLERANCAAPHLPIIVLTGLEDEAVGIEAVRKGAQDYLVKGQTPSRMLLRSIHHAIERKRMEKALRQSEKRLRQQAKLLEHAPILVRNLNDEIILWNAGMEAIYGFSRRRKRLEKSYATCCKHAFRSRALKSKRRCIATAAGKANYIMSPATAGGSWSPACGSAYRYAWTTFGCHRDQQ